MKNFFTLFSLLISSVLLSQPANNNCSSPTNITNLSGGCITFNNTGATYDSYIGSCMGNNNNVWFTFTAQGPTATFTISGPGSSRPELAVIAPTGNNCDINQNVQVGCAAPAGNYAAMTVTQSSLTVGYQYYVMITSTSSGSFTLCTDNPVGTNTAGSICNSASPFCTGSTVTYPAGVNTGQAPLGPAYGCLASRPNPAWFYLQIATSGNIDITMSSSPARDIDFALWGPVGAGFPGGCIDALHAQAIEDCSFSTATSEVANITGAVAGETYIMMITNFSNLATNISFSQTGGTGATDCAILLPIELLSFDVYKKGDYAELKWITASEQNNDYFTIERSADGVDFTAIGKVKGNGNSSSMLYYSLIDAKPLDGVSYYRLKQTDFDGKEKYHQIISLDSKNDKSFDFTIVPNPNNEDQESNLLFNSIPNKDIAITITDINGAVVYDEIKRIDDFKFAIPVKLSKGIYFMKIIAPDNVITKRMIIK